MVDLNDVETGDLIVGTRASPYFIENGNDNHVVWLIERVISVDLENETIDVLAFQSFGKHSKEVCGSLQWKDNDFWTFELVKVKPKPFRSLEIMERLSNDRPSR